MATRGRTRCAREFIHSRCNRGKGEVYNSPRDSVIFLFFLFLISLSLVTLMFEPSKNAARRSTLLPRSGLAKTAWQTMRIYIFMWRLYSNSATIIFCYIILYSVGVFVYYYYSYYYCRFFINEYARLNDGVKMSRFFIYVRWVLWQNLDHSGGFSTEVRESMRNFRSEIEFEIGTILIQI